jgi:DNA-binding PadR family transcriptional regulator
MDTRDERVLMLLGLLATERQHGYQINEFIEQNLSRVSRMPKATAYSMLSRLEKAGLISASSEQKGHRPPRRVYALTAAGEERYHAMLEDLLAVPELREPPGDHALMFIDALPRATAARAMEMRVAALEQEIARLEASPPHGAGLGVDLAIGRRAALAQADRDWFVAALERVRVHLPERPDTPPTV